MTKLAKKQNVSDLKQAVSDETVKITHLYKKRLKKILKTQFWSKKGHVLLILNLFEIKFNQSRPWWTSEFDFTSRIRISLSNSTLNSKFEFEFSCRIRNSPELSEQLH